MKKDHKDNTVGPWAEEKLTHLRSYLEFYCTALSKQNFKRIYLDAFAGAPNATLRSADGAVSERLPDFEILFEDSSSIDRIVLGSPHRALSIANGFDFHYFFDLDENRVTMLSDLENQYPGKTIKIRQGDANQLVQAAAEKIMGKRNFRGVAFLDPYGPQLHWATVEALAKTNMFEVIINFPAHMALNRMIATKQEGRNPAWEAMVSLVMGDEEWKSVVYTQASTLFGEEFDQKCSRVPEILKGLYMNKLKRVFQFVPEPALIHNTRGAPLYYLFWAGQNKRGQDGAKYILGNKSRLARKRRW